MSFKDRFNADIPIKKHGDLEQSVKYSLLKVQIVKTQYGKAALLTLQGSDGKFKLYLGEKYVDAFDMDTIDNINEGIARYTIEYKGVINKSPKFIIE